MTSDGRGDVHDAPMVKRDHGFTGARARVVERARAWLESIGSDFQSDDEVIEAGRFLLAMGSAAEESENRTELKEAEGLLCRVREQLHKGLLGAPVDSVRFAKARVEAELGSVDIEILVILALSGLGLSDGGFGMDDIDDLQKRLSPCDVDPLEIVRALTPESRLVVSGLVCLTEKDRPVEAKVSIEQGFLQLLWQAEPSKSWEFASETEAHDQLRRIALAAKRHLAHAEEDESIERGGEAASRLPAKLGDQVLGFVSGLEAHPNWALSKALAPLDASDGLVFLLLLARDLGHISPSDATVRGAGLATCTSSGSAGFRRALKRLCRDSTLRTQDLIRPCGGLPPGVLAEDEAVLREAEFELSGRVRKVLGVQRQWRSPSGSIRKALVSLDQLVLHGDVLDGIEQAICYARRPSRLLDEWGLRKVMPYGHGTTLLFTGPPGVGKTAAAEAIAHELDKQLLTVDYSSIQSCWVGETEKQVARAFREAADEDAVLFWDEADAMFFDRDSASQNWEVREVNVLLKEIEAFEGVCILATNRDGVLDPALDRRISRRLRFNPPSAEMGAKIWRLMIPDKMPLADEPDYLALGRLGMTGGQIKNAVMEVARAAIQRTDCTAVHFQDILAVATRQASSTGPPSIGFK
jgi:hypothetical protein